MKGIASLALILSGGFLACAKVVDYSEIKNSNAANYVPGKWIVEYGGSHSTKKRTVDPHEAFHHQMKKSSIPYEVTRTFDSDGLFVGATINLDDANAALVKSLPGVINAYRVKVVPRPTDGDTASVINGKRTSPVDTFSTHQMTGVDKLHAAGILGKGVLVAEIDTGIDYTHPALGGCFGKGCKVVKGWDFVGDAYTGSNDPIPDPDPKDCAGHGTHVAGIIGANANPLNFTGVAPEASLAIYRVFGCSGNSQNDVIMAAMIRAAEEKADIISMSLGGVSGWTEDPESVLAARIAKRGIVVSISAGNSGAEGLFYASAPASGMGVIAVSSVDNVVTPGKYADLLTAQGYPPILIAGTADLDPETKFSIAVSDFDTSVTDDGCSAYPSTVNFTNKVTIVKRGTCAFAVKAQNIQNAGGSIALIYNNLADGAVSPSITPVTNFTAVGITQADGQAIIAAVQAKPSVKISFPDSYRNFPNTDTGGLVSDFTSYGLTNDLFIKPSVAAPGGNILSTWPLDLGGYTVISGTSMACPFISGVAALFISRNGHMKPHTIKTIIETTAIPISTVINGTDLNTVAQQGGGLVNAWAAVNYQTILSVSEFALNDTDHLVSSSKFTINNKGSENVKYTISHVPAQAALTFSGNSSQIAAVVPLVDGPAKLAFSTKHLTIQAGGADQVEVNFSAPDLDASDVPIYSGFIQIKSDQETMHIPYAGVAASMNSDYPIFDTSDYYFGFDLPALLDGDGNVVDVPANFSFVGEDQPTLLLRLLGGTASLLVDLVSANTTFTPSIVARAPKTPKSLGTLIDIPYNYRNTPSSTVNYEGYDQLSLTSSNNTFTYTDASNNTVGVQNGAYKVLVRGLKFFGDANKNEDYESWLSPIFNVVQP